MAGILRSVRRMMMSTILSSKKIVYCGSPKKNSFLGVRVKRFVDAGVEEVNAQLNGVEAKELEMEEVYYGILRNSRPFTVISHLLKSPQLLYTPNF
jgi:hypothetical protein